MYRLRSNQITNIKNSKLSKKFNKIVIIWDNAKSHISNHVKDILKILEVKLVPLPVRCPKYNPIEHTWKDNKYETAKEPIDNENHLKEFFERKFYELVEKNSYTNYWYDLIENKRNSYDDSNA
ncbi:MAG: transposase [Methanobrevibacter sp.]|jgi:transposase|nr:transposase [Candidatus Methanovirga aequatorialis]